MADNSSVPVVADSGSKLPIILGVLALVLVGGGAYYVFSKKAAPSTKGDKTAGKGNKGAKGGAAGSSSTSGTDSTSTDNAGSADTTGSSGTSSSGSSSTSTTTAESVAAASIDAKAIKQQIEWSTPTVLGHTPKNSKEWKAAGEAAWNSPPAAIATMIKALNDNGYLLKRDASVYPISDSTTVDGNPIGSLAPAKIYSLQALVLQNKANISSN